jgi:hypothetical protein
MAEVGACRPMRTGPAFTDRSRTPSVTTVGYREAAKLKLTVVNFEKLFDAVALNNFQLQ